MTMCEPLPQSDCGRTELEELILSAVVFLVKMCPAQGGKPDSSAPTVRSLEAACGGKCFASLSMSKQDGYWQRMYGTYSVLPMFEDAREEPSDKYLKTWPRMGIMLRGFAMELPTLGRRTKGTGCLSWPTPRANDAEKRGEIGSDIRNGLPAAVRHWPTPTVPNGGRSPKGGCMSLTGMTPDGKKRQVDLQYAVKSWPTPKGSVSGPDYARINRKDSGGNDLVTAIAHKEKGQLNADWVECLMNFPIGWTDIECDNPVPWPGPPALLGIGLTQSGQYHYEPPRVTTGQKNRAKRLKCLGNAVYPEQIYPIFAAIREIEAG